MTESSQQILKSNTFDILNFDINEEGDKKYEAYNFNDPGTELPGSPMGKSYHIMLLSKYKENEEPEFFTAILSSPIDYVDRVMNDGFYGTIVRATTTSHTFVDTVLVKIKQFLESRKNKDDE